MVAEVAKFKSNLKTLFCGYSRTIFLTFGSYLSVYTVACESSRIFFSVAEATLRRIWQAVSCCPVLLPHLLALPLMVAESTQKVGEPQR